MLAPATALPADFVAGNHFDKYRTRNPLYQVLVGGFLANARELLALARPASILEVGCGPGDLMDRLLSNPGNPDAIAAKYIGTDISAEQIAIATQRYPQRAFQTADVYALPFRDRSFDLVIASEVLEHLTDPAAAVDEITRVTDHCALISVPREPLWRVLNVLRGRYLARGGNTPGHVQHFSPAVVRALVRRRLEIAAERRPLPWVILLGRRTQAPMNDRDRRLRRSAHV
jgi:SAM-dependent methyltransferase